MQGDRQSDIEDRLAAARLADQWLSTDEAAAELGMTRGRLVHLRRQGRGPPDFPLSARRVWYRLSDVLAWEASK